MARTLLDNIGPLSWEPESFEALDTASAGPVIARCPLTRMSFKIVQGKKGVSGVFVGPEKRVEGRWENPEMARAAANAARVEEIKRLMAPSVEISILPLSWGRSPENPSDLVAACPITGTRFRITGTHAGYVGHVSVPGASEKQFGDAVGSPNVLRDRFEETRKRGVLPHLTKDVAPSPMDLEADQDPLVWSTRRGEELRMSEIKDGHLMSIITYLTARADAAKWDEQRANGSFLVGLRASITRMDAQLDMFTAEAKKRGVQKEDPDETPFFS